MKTIIKKPHRGGIFPALLMLFACPCLYSWGAAETPEPDDVRQYTATITGIVRLVGSEPFSRLIVSTDGEKTYIIDEDSPERKRLHSMQGQRVSMEGTVREYPVHAGEQYLGIEYVITPVHYDAAPPAATQ